MEKWIKCPICNKKWFPTKGNLIVENLEHQCKNCKKKFILHINEEQQQYNINEREPEP